MKASATSLPVRSRASISERASFGVEPDRLLAQDVLARLERLDRPRDVEFVRQRIVDRLDLGIGQKLLVGAVGAQRCRAVRRPRRALARSREAMAAISRSLAALHRGDHLFGGDIGDAEHAPFHLAQRRLPSNGAAPRLTPSVPARGLRPGAPASSRDIPASAR